MDDVPKTRSSGLSTVLLVAAIGLCVYLSALMTAPFLPALVFSITLAVLAVPLDRRLRARFGSPGAAAAATVALVVFAVVIPMLMVTATLLGEAVRSAAAVGAMIDGATWERVIADHPSLAPALKWIDARVDVPGLVQTGTEALATWGGSVLKGSAAGVLNLILTFYFLFYLLRDRERAIAATASVLPLTEEEFTALRVRISDTIHATVYGTVAVSALQGLLGGLMFWWLGLPAPVFWGVLMGALAVVPFLGAFVIWAPVAVSLALSERYASAALLTAWGTVVVGLVDNVVFPMLVGWRLMLHTVTSFIAVAGGLLAFGAPGVILGPVIASASLVLLGIWRNRALATPPDVRP